MVEHHPLQCLEWVAYKLIDRVFGVEFDLFELDVQVPENVDNNQMRLI